MQHLVNILAFFTGPQVITRQVQTSLGDYQTTIRVGRKTYLGVGHTPAESRRNAIDAANIGTGTNVFEFLGDRIAMTTERASAGRMLA